MESSVTGCFRRGMADPIMSSYELSAPPRFSAVTPPSGITVTANIGAGGIRRWWAPGGSVPVDASWQQAPARVAPTRGSTVAVVRRPTVFP